MSELLSHEQPDRAAVLMVATVGRLAGLALGAELVAAAVARWRTRGERRPAQVAASWRMEIESGATAERGEPADRITVAA